MPSWSPEELQTLKEYAAAGASRARLAARLRRTEAAVKTEARKHGIELKSSKQVRKANGLSGHWSDNRDF